MFGRATITLGIGPHSSTVNAFKYRLDKHWSNQDVLFDFNADLLTGTGSVRVPICV